MTKKDENVTIRTICNRMCIMCGLAVHIVNGVITKVVLADFSDWGRPECLCKKAGIMPVGISPRPSSISPET